MPYDSRESNSDHRKRFTGLNCERGSSKSILDEKPVDRSRGIKRPLIFEIPGPVTTGAERSGRFNSNCPKCPPELPELDAFRLGTSAAPADSASPWTTLMALDVLPGQVRVNNFAFGGVSRPYFEGLLHRRDELRNRRHRLKPGRLVPSPELSPPELSRVDLSCLSCHACNPGIKSGTSTIRRRLSNAETGLNVSRTPFIGRQVQP